MGGSTNHYETTITNHSTLTYMLPETGGSGTTPYTACGFVLILSATWLLLVHKQKSRRREDP